MKNSFKRPNCILHFAGHLLEVLGTVLLLPLIVAMDGFPSQCIFIVVYAEQRGQFSVPRGEQAIPEGDELFLIAPAGNIKKVDEFLASTRKA